MHEEDLEVYKIRGSGLIKPSSIFWKIPMNKNKSNKIAAVSPLQQGPPTPMGHRGFPACGLAVADV